MIPRKLVRLTSLLRWYLYRLSHRRGFRLYPLDGYKMYLDVGEFFTMYERLIGDFEPDKRRFITGVLRPGGTFVDIGVNKGDYALLAATCVGPSGRVVAIEPEPANCTWVRRSIEANGFGNIELIEAAADERAGTAELFIGKKSGWHSLVPGAGASGETLEVATLALDAIDSGGLAPDLIKIDVEGVEHRVLAGASDTVDRCRPTFVIDLHPHLGADIDAVERFFDSRSYHAFALREPETRLERLPREPMDVVFRPAEQCPGAGNPA